MTIQDTQLTKLLPTANVPTVIPGRLTAPKTGIYRNRFKRMIDIALIVISLPFVLPIVGALALLVALDGGKPFYSQDRIGRKGRTFKIWKLRSMVRNADEVLETYLDENPAMRAEWNSKQKLLDDPRVTRIGHIIRKTSIDELPQLFNVLKGDMSLVGPRPMMVEQKPMYPGREYYELRPGITGFWQISDRNQTTFADRAFYDARYNHQLSLKTDADILMRTVKVVWSGTGC